MDLPAFHIFLIAMSLLAAVVCVALYFVKAGYGMFRTRSWGWSLPNKLAWFLMEVPVFLVYGFLWYTSARRDQPVAIVFLLLFQLHYLQRAFVFPLLLKGKSRMPVAIMCMGIVFNLLNGYMQGYWLFHLAPADDYTTEWLYSLPFVIGIVLFFVGMGINWHSDHVIRHLREPGDTKHYLPQKGMYRYVTSANYFGEIVEWAGFALLTCSWAGAVFLWWSIANLVPRANAIWHRYREEFGAEMGSRKRVFPFMY